jgi:hypothetical protein
MHCVVFCFVQVPKQRFLLMWECCKEMVFLLWNWNAFCPLCSKPASPRSRWPLAWDRDCSKRVNNFLVVIVLLNSCFLVCEHNEENKKI